MNHPLLEKVKARRRHLAHLVKQRGLSPILVAQVRQGLVFVEAVRGELRDSEEENRLNEQAEYEIE